MVRAEVRFRGHVQGVGFRFACSTLAKEYAVTGFVRNEADRSVFLVAEGERKVILDFVESICERMNDFIQEHTIVWSESTNRWSTFAIER